jgi:hypothetical protein
MKKLLSILILGTAYVVYADDLNYFLVPTNEVTEAKQKMGWYKSALAEGFFVITTNQEAEIKQKLDAYEKGKLHVSDLTINAGPEANRELIGYYLMHTNDISAKSKLPISVSYVGCCAYPEVIKLATEYLSVYPNDRNGWRILGNAYVLMDLLDNLTNASNKALQAYVHAVKLGDKDSLEPLSYAAFKNGRMDIIKKIVPQLMDLRQSKYASKEDKLGITSILLGYSLKTNRKDIFIKTLNGINMDEALQDDSIKMDVTLGCKIFTGKEIEKLRKQLDDFDLKNPQANTAH